MVEFAARIDFVEVRACGKQGLVHRHDRQQQFKRAGGADEMAMHGFGGRHPRIPCAGAKHLAQCGGFDDVAAIRRGGMRIDPEEIRDQIIEARELYKDLVQK